MRGHIWEQANNHFYEYSYLYDSARGQQPLRAFVYARRMRVYMRIQHSKLPSSQSKNIEEMSVSSKKDFEEM